MGTNCSAAACQPCDKVASSPSSGECSCVYICVLEEGELVLVSIQRHGSRGSCTISLFGNVKQGRDPSASGRARHTDVPSVEFSESSATPRYSQFGCLWMPSLSNDPISGPNQIGVIMLGCLTGSQGPLKVTWQSGVLISERVQSRTGDGSFEFQLLSGWFTSRS